MKHYLGLMLLLVIQLFFLYLGNIATLSKTEKKGYNNSLFLKVSGLSVFFLKKKGNLQIDNCSYLFCLFCNSCLIIF